MRVIPAIDIIDGKAVRLTKGDFSAKKVYSDDIYGVAKGFLDQGARALHIVDLDGAKQGKPVNSGIISSIIDSFGGSLEIEVGGGLRRESDAAFYLDAGAKHAIIGTAAVEDNDFLIRLAAAFGDGIAVGIDAKNDFAATRGWLGETGVSGFEMAEKLVSEGIRHIIYTDISRDGTLGGGNIPLYKKLAAISGIVLTASGGISGVDEIIKLKEMGLCGVILGKALYEGKITLKEALSAAYDC